MTGHKQKDEIINVEEVLLEEDTATNVITMNSGIHRIIEVSDEELALVEGTGKEANED